MRTGTQVRYHRGDEKMGEEKRNAISRRGNPSIGTVSNAGQRDTVVPGGQEAGEAPVFDGPDDINPLEPWILSDGKGLVRRHWRRKQAEG